MHCVYHPSPLPFWGLDAHQFNLRATQPLNLQAGRVGAKRSGGETTCITTTSIFIINSQSVTGFFWWYRKNLVLEKVWEPAEEKFYTMNDTLIIATQQYFTNTISPFLNKLHLYLFLSVFLELYSFCIRISRAVIVL